MKISQKDLQWSAGIFEGEGSIYIIWNKQILKTGKEARYIDHRAKVNMVDEDIIRKFHSLISRGTVTHVKPYRINYQWQFQWHVSNKVDVLWFIKWFKPLLGIRRQTQCQLVADAIVQYYNII